MTTIPALIASLREDADRKDASYAHYTASVERSAAAALERLQGIEAERDSLLTDKRILKDFLHVAEAAGDRHEAEIERLQEEVERLNKANDARANYLRDKKQSPLDAYVDEAEKQIAAMKADLTRLRSIEAAARETVEAKERLAGIYGAAFDRAITALEQALGEK